MKWLFDTRDAHSRLMIGIDHWGVAINEWTENDGDEVGYPYVKLTGFFEWCDVFARLRTGQWGGRLVDRLTYAALDLLRDRGGNSELAESLTDGD